MGETPVHWPPFPQRLVFARLAGAAMFLFVSLCARSLLAQQTMEQPSADEPGPAQVFTPASAEQRSSITHPKLRSELLQMAHKDQVARSAAT